MTKSKIFLAEGSEGELAAMTETPYQAESHLQEFLERYSELLPGDQIDPDNPRRWLLVKREMAVPDDIDDGGRWSLDHLFLDQDGRPTFVECKRASDSRGRREVVAQMLDYAANGVEYWGVETILEAALETSKAANKDLEEEIRKLVASDAEDVVKSYWDKVRSNLEAGRVRLIFVSDETPRELRRLVQFLHDKMQDVEVIAVEVKQYLTDDGRTKAFVSRVVGNVDSPGRRKTEQPTYATPVSFFNDCSPSAQNFYRTVAEVAEELRIQQNWDYQVGFSLSAAGPNGDVVKFARGKPKYFRIRVDRIADATGMSDVERDTLAASLKALGPFEWFHNPPGPEPSLRLPLEMVDSSELQRLVRPLLARVKDVLASPSSRVPR